MLVILVTLWGKICLLKCCNLGKIHKFHYKNICGCNNFLFFKAWVCQYFTECLNLVDNWREKSRRNLPGPYRTCLFKSKCNWSRITCTNGWSLRSSFRYLYIFFQQIEHVQPKLYSVLKPSFTKIKTNKTERSICFQGTPKIALLVLPIKSVMCD